MSSRWVLLDCGDTLEIVHRRCGRSETTTPIRKQSFLDSTWDEINKWYVKGEERVLDAGGLPAQIKDELARIRIAGNPEQVVSQLREQSSKAASSRRIMSAYGVVAIALLFLSGYFYSVYSQYLLAGVFFVVFVVLLLSLNRFRRWRAPWSIRLEERLFLRLWEALRNLRTFVQSGANQAFCAEAVRLLNLSAFAGDAVNSEWNLVSIAPRQIARIVRNISTRIKPYVEQNKTNLKQIDKLAIPTLNHLLPLLIEPDLAEIEAWNDMVEAQWPSPAALGLTFRDIRALTSNLWFRAIAVCLASSLVLVIGSLIEGLNILVYFGRVYWQFVTLTVTLLLGVVFVIPRSQRSVR
jgi:hypothetical protein